MVQAWLNAVPQAGEGGWKHAACKRIDALIGEAVPGVSKAVKWNTPLYSAPNAESRDHFFIGYHCATSYVKVSFFRGASLDRMPPENSSQEKVRYLHLREGDEMRGQVADWVRQAAVLPGVKM